MIKAYWGTLNERDRRMLVIGTIVCVVYLFYLLIYAPVTRAVQNKSKQLIEKQETLVWMQHVRTSEQLKTKKVAQSLTSSQLLTVIAEQLSRTTFKQYRYQLQQTGVSDIQLSFDKVPYNAFMAWVWSINQKYTVIIKQLNVDRTDVSGVVKLTIMIATK